MRSFLVPVMLAAAAASACGGGGTAADDRTTPSAPPTSVATTETTTSPPAPTCSAEGTELQVVAREVEFDTDCLAVPADTPFTIELDSVDIAPHNIAIQEPDGELFFDGDTVQGETIIYEVDPIPPGTYRFYCEVHPAQMQGVFIAE